MIATLTNNLTFCALQSAQKNLGDLKIMKTFRNWLVSQYNQDELRDLAERGAQDGFNGMIYHSETSELYKKHYDEIWEMLQEDAEAQGITELQLIASFGGAEHACNKQKFENLLVWYAAERTAQKIIDEIEFNDNLLATR